MKDMIKGVLVIFLITLVAGALLGVVYQVTKEPIRIQKEIAAQKADQAAFPGRNSRIMKDLIRLRQMPL